MAPPTSGSYAPRDLERAVDGAALRRIESGTWGRTRADDVCVPALTARRGLPRQGPDGWHRWPTDLIPPDRSRSGRSV